MRTNGKKSHVIGVIFMLFDDARLQFVELDLSKDSTNRNKKVVEPVDTEPIAFKYKDMGFLRSCALIMSSKVLIFLSKKVILIDLRDADNILSINPPDQDLKHI